MSKCNRDCFNCIYDDCIEGNIAMVKQYEKRKKRQREIQRWKYAEARAQGLCGSCRKVKATHGALCDRCYQRFKHYRMVANAEKRKEKWVMREETASFVGALISGDFATSTISNYRRSVKKFFSMYDEVTRENLLAFKAELIDEYSPKTASCMCSAMNSYCDFIGQPECKVPMMVGKAKGGSRTNDLH